MNLPKLSMHCIGKISIFREFGSVTLPQLVKMVNELDRRVYRTYVPRVECSTESLRLKNPIELRKEKIFKERSSSEKNVDFGDLSTRADDYSDLEKSPFFEEKLEIEPPDHELEDATRKHDHHLRLSATGRKHDPNWYLGRIHRFCSSGNTQLALQVFFKEMLITDRVMPDRNIIHVLLSGLANVGDSESAFKVYRKMTELGIAATFATYSRLFKACAEDIAAWQRKHRYVLEAPQLALDSHLSSNLSSFAGPGLLRAKGLWIRLHERGTQLNKFVYNTLLFALARGGDLNSCFQALDEMLGLGGLPAPLIPPNNPNVGLALPPFRPDEYTLTAVLTAVQMAFKAGVLTDSMKAMSLGLQLWHVIYPRLRCRPSEHNFTLLVGILSLNDYKIKKFMLPPAFPSITQPPKSPCKSLDLIPDQLPNIKFVASNNNSIVESKSRLLMSENAAKEILNKFSNISLISTRIPQSTSHRPAYQSKITSDHISPSQTALENVVGETSALNKSPSNPVADLFFEDEQLALKSPVNLLLHLPANGYSIPLPLTKSSQSEKHLNWQKLALLGGLHGFLDCMKSEFHVSPSAPQLFTKLVGLFPPPPPSLEPPTDDENPSPSSFDLDVWESALLDCLKCYRIHLDLPLLNTLIHRRAKASQGIKGLIQLANRYGLTPDDHTWNSFAMSCRTAESVKNFLRDYSNTAAATNTSSADSAQPIPFLQTSVRPSLYIYATLLAVTEYKWEAKCIILRSMLGRSITKARSKFPKNDKNTDQRKSSKSNDSPYKCDTLYTDCISPNRRMIANLEMEIARFRDLVMRGIVPADNSSVPACDATGGVIIPPFSIKAFKKFLPIYKTWCKQSSVED